MNALLGRTIIPDDDKPDAPPAAVISARYWRSRFGSDPATVGKLIRINNVPVTLLAFFRLRSPAFNKRSATVTTSRYPSRSRPLSTGPAKQSPRINQPTYWWLQVMGRLKQGATAAQVQGNLEGVFQQTARAGLSGYWLPFRGGAGDNAATGIVPKCLAFESNGKAAIYDEVRPTSGR